MTTDTKIGLIATLLGAVIGYYLKFYLDRKKEYTTEVYKERRETYQKFVDIVLDHISNVKSNSNNNLRKEIYTFYKKSILYSSPEVTIAFANFFQFLYANKNTELDTKTTLLLLTNIIKEMRSDLGLSNRNLGENGELLIKPIFNDYDQVINT